MTRADSAPRVRSEEPGEYRTSARARRRARLVEGMKTAVCFAVAFLVALFFGVGLYHVWPAAPWALCVGVFFLVAMGLDKWRAH